MKENWNQTLKIILVSYNLKSKFPNLMRDFKSGIK